MKTHTWHGCLPFIFASFLASCTGGGILGHHGDKGDGGLDMGVAMQGLLADQSFCFTWNLFQEDASGKWAMIDQRTDAVCSAPGSDESLTDFATCYDGQHFMVQYDVSVLDASGAVIGEANATSGGGPNDVCVKNVDTPSEATIQFNNEGSAGGVNPGIDIDQVCSNNKLQLEGSDLVSALWLQPDGCAGTGTPDSFCTLGSGSGISTQRVDFTLDGLTRFIFNSALVGSTWDLIYLAFPADLDLSTLTLLNSPFALHHYSAGLNYGVATMTDSIGSWRLGDSVGVINRVDSKIVIDFDLSANCDSDIDLDSHEQVIDLGAQCSGGCDPIGVVAAGDSAFDLVLSCAGDIMTIPCDARGMGDGICNPG